MYAALWRRLPGPVPVRVVIALVLLALVVVGCFRWVFPWIAAHLPVNDPTVGGLALAALNVRPTGHPLLLTPALV